MEHQTDVLGIATGKQCIAASSNFGCSVMTDAFPVSFTTRNGAGRGSISLFWGAQQVDSGHRVTFLVWDSSKPDSRHSVVFSGSRAEPCSAPWLSAEDRQSSVAIEVLLLVQVVGDVWRVHALLSGWMLAFLLLRFEVLQLTMMLLQTVLPVEFSMRVLLQV